MSESNFNQIDGNDKVTSKSRQKFGDSIIETGINNTTFQNAQSTLKSHIADEMNVLSGEVNKTNETSQLVHSANST